MRCIRGDVTQWVIARQRGFYYPPANSPSGVGKRQISRKKPPKGGFFLEMINYLRGILRLDRRPGYEPEYQGKLYQL